MKTLEGKVAVITGGSSGIGLATAKRFVEEGAHVVITGRREKELKEAAAFIKRNVTTVVGDVSRLEDLDRLYAVVKEKHGHIDILFANAGAGTIAPLAVATEAHFEQTFDVNVKGLFFTVQKALPLFKDGGSIILNSSVSNVLGVPGFSAYAASKAAVRNFSRAWTLELKDRKIRVNTMSPGPIEPPALETTTGLTPEQAEQAAAQFASQIPMGRRGKPEEIAAAVTFLASDESSFITAVDLAVDVGMARVWPGRGPVAGLRSRQSCDHHSQTSFLTQDRRGIMSYAIIGFGKIGHALAKAFARNDIEVSAATTRDPESFASDAAAIGPTIIPKTLAEAVKADILFLAVRFESHKEVAKALSNWKGKTIIDVTNAYGVPPEELGGLPSSKAVAKAFTGARLVKGFNHLVAAVLDQDPAVHGGRRVVFLASDDDGAAAEIGALAETLGFAPIKLGGLSEGGLLVQARGNSWGRLIFRDLVKFD